MAPAALDGSTATEAQVKAEHADVMDFLKSSDDYQTCLLSDLAAQKKKAAQSQDKNKVPFDTSIESDVNAKIAANQKLKEQVGGEYNAAAKAYLAKHPAPAAA